MLFDKKSLKNIEKTIIKAEDQEEEDKDEHELQAKKTNNHLFDKKKYYSPNQEWNSSIYLFDKNHIKLLCSKNYIVNKFIKSFFNLTFFSKKIMSFHKRIRFKRESTNRIFISKFFLKHTNNKIILTLFSYNRERYYILKKMVNIYLKLIFGKRKVSKFKRRIYIQLKQLGLLTKIKLKVFKLYKVYIKRRQKEKKILYLIKFYNYILNRMYRMKKTTIINNKIKTILSIMYKLKLQLKLIKKKKNNAYKNLLRIKKKKKIIIKRIKRIKNLKKKIMKIKKYIWRFSKKKNNNLRINKYSRKLKLILFNKKFLLSNKINKDKILLYKLLKLNKLNLIRYKINSCYYKNLLKLERSFLYYNKILLLNSYKFKNFFLLNLKNLIKKIYNKPVEFRIINLKNIYMNSDIFTESISIKLKKRNLKLLKVLKTALNIVKIPIKNKVFWSRFKYKSRNIFFNNANTIFFNHENNYHRDIVNDFLSNIFNKNNKNINIINSNNIKKNLYNSINYKYINGVRLEAGGRLTKRLTASRSVFKIKHKGTLKNIYCSYNNSSTLLLKGFSRSNIQYTKINSKTRNGSFGLKGWVSSY